MNQGDTNPNEEAGASGQFGEDEDTGQGTNLTAQMESVGPDAGNLPPAAGDGGVSAANAPAADAMNLGSPKGGGDDPGAADSGLGRYGGEDETLSPNRYAGASDDAPTSPTAGATTTLAAISAGGAEHEMRESSDSAADPATSDGGHS